MKAKKIVLLVKDEDKAEAVKGLLNGNTTTHNVSNNVTNA
jgi:glucosamine-6-phosphate deaminase